MHSSVFGCQVASWPIIEGISLLLRNIDILKIGLIQPLFVVLKPTSHIVCGIPV